MLSPLTYFHFHFLMFIKSIQPAPLSRNHIQAPMMPGQADHPPNSSMTRLLIYAAHSIGEAGLSLLCVFFGGRG